MIPHARDCSISFIDADDAADFIRMHHKDGNLKTDRSKGVAVGLIYDAEILAIAQFSSPQDSVMRSKYSVEILRIAFRGGLEISGSVTRMISFFINERRPSDFFTYQDASLESPDAYISAGMVLKDSFETPLYEWIDPNRSYYVYKLHSESSSKFYIGVRQLPFANATESDCIADTYLGSGKGAHFQNWRAKHLLSAQLRKEILGIFPRKMQAYTLEATLIGDLWKTDPNCLNSCTGGLAGGILNQAAGVLEFASSYCSKCEDETTHQKGSCLRCRVFSGRATIYCVECMSETLHRNEKCYKCVSRQIFSDKFCSTCDAITVHRKDNCCNCANQAAVSLKWCGKCETESKHQGDTCSTCNARKSVSLLTCPVHGKTKHQGYVCNKCNAESSVHEQYCESCKSTTKHQSGKCYSCKNLEIVNEKYCEACNVVTKHAGDNCYKCRLKVKISFCEKCQNETKHNGSECIPCRPGPIKELYCSECQKNTKFRGKACLSCKTRALFHNCDECEKETKHKLNGNCIPCETRAKRKLAKSLKSTRQT